jgi:hypothetical protein
MNVEPVLLCGYPKSGTTLLLALLDHHPDLLVFPEETRFFREVRYQPENQTVEYVLSKTGANAFRHDEVTWPSGYRDYSAINFENYERAVQDFWNRSQQNPYDLLESQILAYGEVTEQTGKKLWVEKTPYNENHLSDAAAHYPNLRAVFILRDPRDNFASYSLQRRKQNRDLTLHAFLESWMNSLHNWSKFASDHPTQAFSIHYRDLATNPREMMERLAAFLEIPYNDSLLNPTRNGVFWSGNSMYGTKHEAISASSVDKYKESLSLDEIKHLEYMLRPIFLQFGWNFDYQAGLLKQGYRLYKKRKQESTALDQQATLTAKLLKNVNW